MARALRALRARRGWSITEVALRAELTETRVAALEASASSATVAELDALADAFEITPGCLYPLMHPLEAEWNVSAWDVLTATARGFRAKVCVIGKLAELKLHEILEEYRQLDPRLRDVVWNDQDGEPDFVVSWDGAPIRVECKNVRRDVKRPGLLRVELQKTRNSKDGSNTRSYRKDKFDLLAACLYNQSKAWRFVYCPIRRLATAADEQFLAVYHEIPTPLQAPWTDKLVDALAAAL
jgi:transcriptional regulator with XRE-family HTH domain